MTQTTATSGRQHTLPPRLSTADVRVLVLSVALAWGGVMLFLRHVQTLPTPSVPVHVPVWTMIAAFAAAEVFVVYLHFRDETHAFSFGEIPLIVGLFLLAPGSLIAVNLAGSAMALLCLRPVRPLKVLFNLSHFALEACLAVLVFHAIASSVDPLHPLSWLAAYGAALVSDLVGAVAIQSVIVVHQGRGEESFLPVLASAIVSALTNTSLGLVAVMLLWVQPLATLMLFVVAALVVMAYRGYTRQQRQLQDLQVFNDFTRAVTDVSDPAVLLHSLLTHARDALRARAVEIVLPGAAADEPWTHATLDERDGLQVSALRQLGLLHARVSDGSPALVVSQKSRDPRLRALAMSAGVTDALAGALQERGMTTGVMVVSDRLGDVDTFSRDDLALFEMLSTHAAVLLQNGHLVQRLQHQASHDLLTGLYNRERFLEQTGLAVERAATVGVALLDIDRFKEVNDTLGHHTGDLLLREIGLRLRACMGSHAVIARLGGDHFAVLLEDVADLRDAVDRASALRAAVTRPLMVDRITLEVSVSMGLALSIEHGNDPDLLLRRADVASEAAKADHAEVSVYSNERDPYTPTRLALAGELRAAIEQGELTVVFQPKVKLATGEVSGLEALVRWDHPTRGPITPADFIPVAEQTGLIRPLTTFVLDEALGWVRAWRDDELELPVAVNLSARSLTDDGLPADVERLLHKHDITPDYLTFEITETSVMADADQTNGVLHRLRALGVRLSIDDFGTGYSSLVYLKRLAVDELKVDQSFVRDMTRDANDWAIVRSTLEMAHHLGLSVVAEGIEDAHTWQALREMGCDIAQGYFLSRPLPAGHVAAWVRTTELRQASLPDMIFGRRSALDLQT